MSRSVEALAHDTHRSITLSPEQRSQLTDPLSLLQELAKQEGLPTIIRPLPPKVTTYQHIGNSIRAPEVLSLPQVQTILLSCFGPPPISEARIGELDYPETIPEEGEDKRAGKAIVTLMLLKVPAKAIRGNEQTGEQSIIETFKWALYGIKPYGERFFYGYQTDEDVKARNAKFKDQL